VLRDDALNGTHWDVYAYDPVSGRLASVQDVWTGETNGFVWNPEGTLARWEEPNSYAQVFGYDEEGRLTKIERDYGAGSVQVACEYGYNSDGARVWKRDVLNEQEYRYVCRIGCGGVPMRVYNRPLSGGSWASVEDYLPAGNALGYNQNWQYQYSGGELLMMTASGEPSVYYPMDSNGLAVQKVPAQPCICAVVVPARTAVCPPLGYGECSVVDIPDLLDPRSHIDYPPPGCWWNPECIMNCFRYGLAAIAGCTFHCAGKKAIQRCLLTLGCLVVCVVMGLANPVCIRCMIKAGRLCLPIILGCLIPCIGMWMPVITACFLSCYECRPTSRPPYFNPPGVYPPFPPIAVPI
jgi:hypothetical protein